MKYIPLKKNLQLIITFWKDNGNGSAKLPSYR
jgi:hypothetical protein